MTTEKRNSIDFNNIGKHCSFETCNRLDFLPIKCDLCHFYFCKEHFSLINHKCPKYEETNEQNKTNSTNLSPINFYACSFDDCKQKEMVHVVCEYCNKTLCMKHRLQKDHKCLKLKNTSNDSNKTKARDNVEFKFEIKQNVSEKNASLAAKLTLMKLKQTAIGPPGLPELSKYFCFIIQNDDQATKKPFFFSTKWPIGKCIEFLLDKLNIDKSKLAKLGLFLNDSLILSSFTVEELMKNNTFSSQGLTLSLKEK